MGNALGSSAKERFRALKAPLIIANSCPQASFQIDNPYDYGDVFSVG